MTEPVRGPVREVQRKAELWVETKDGNVVGKIDLVVQDDGEVQIVDYKTGNVEDELGSGVLKQEYQVQMKLYAALYHEKYNIWPARLSLISINQKKYEVVFDEGECSRLLEQAQKVISKTNELIDGGFEATKFANPSPLSCAHCLYRPACQKYWESRNDNGKWPLDVTGEIKEKKILGNNSFRVEIRNSDSRTVIRGLSLERNNFLNENVHNILFCDLYHDTSPCYYLEGLLTTGYALQNGN